MIGQSPLNKFLNSAVNLRYFLIKLKLKRKIH